jgi:hypothetical protein
MPDETNDAVEQTRYSRPPSPMPRCWRRIVGGSCVEHPLTEPAAEREAAWAPCGSPWSRRQSEVLAWSPNESRFWNGWSVEREPSCLLPLQGMHLAERSTPGRPLLLLDEVSA